jgi:hypothetical protein
MDGRRCEAAVIGLREQEVRAERNETVCVVAPSLALSVMIERDES